jgi:hypothetical protein
MDARKALEALDAKVGRMHTRDDMRLVYEKSLSNPAAIMEDDLTIVRYFHNDQTAAEYAARRAAAIAGPPPAPAPVQTKTADRPVTRRFLSKTLDAIAADVGGALAELVKRQKATITALESRIAQLESRPLQKWAGVHVTGMQYSEASLVTHGGSLWVATETTTGTPGTEASGWRLIVKRGHA